MSFLTKSEEIIPNQCAEGDIIEPDHVSNKSFVIQTGYHLEDGSQGHPSSNASSPSSSSECVSESSLELEEKNLPDSRPNIRVIDETSAQFYYKRMTKLEMLASFFLPVALIREIRFNQKAKKAVKAQKKEAASNSWKEISVQSKAFFGVKLPFSKPVITDAPLQVPPFVNVEAESKSWMKTKKLRVKVPKKLKFNRPGSVFTLATQQDEVEQKPKKHSKSKKQKSEPAKSDISSPFAPSLASGKPYFRIFVESFETKAKASMYVEPWCPVANVIQAAHVKMGDCGHHDQKEYLLIKGLIMRNLPLEQYGVHEDDVLCVIKHSSLQLINASMAEADIVQPLKEEPKTVKEPEEPQERESFKEVCLEHEVKNEESEKDVEFNSDTYAYETNSTIKVFC
uniref:Coilin n=1 Tax=Ditylenchus dipsaci TaxID=166011 RepID=A0A915DWH4_9BILA